MTDRINSFLVTLDRDIRDDDIEEIVTALRMVKFVAGVHPNVSSLDAVLAEERFRHDTGQRILKAVGDIVYNRTPKA